MAREIEQLQNVPESSSHAISSLKHDAAQCLQCSLQEMNPTGTSMSAKQARSLIKQQAHARANSTPMDTGDSTPVLAAEVLGNLVYLVLVKFLHLTTDY